MRGNIASLLLSCAILNVCAGRVFDEKSEAIKEIDAKYKEAVILGNRTFNSVEAEKKLINNRGEEELKNYLNLKINETNVEFLKDASAVIRTAIVQDKPVSVIYCIRNVIYSGNRTIINARTENLEKVFKVKLNKLEKIDFDAYAIKAIITGLTELMEQAKKKITEGSDVIQTVKKEALKRCDSAIFHLGEIEVCLHEPILGKEYIKTRQAIDLNLRETKKALNAELEACLK